MSINVFKKHRGNKITFSNRAILCGELRDVFKCVEALGRIIIRGPYPPSNAIIYMHLQL